MRPHHSVSGVQDKWALISCICNALAQTGQCSVGWQNDGKFSSNKRNLILSTEHFWLPSKSTDQLSTSLNTTEQDWTRWQRNILHWTFVQCMFSANVQLFCQGLTLFHMEGWGVLRPPQPTFSTLRRNDTRYDDQTFVTFTQI